MIQQKVKRKAGNPNFVRGHKAYSKGRPKGSYSDATLSFLKLREIASTRAEEALAMLWQAMERGESWAYQIYFKELYTIPKDIDMKKVTITDKNPTVDGQIEVLTGILPEFDEVTHDESLNRLKVLNAVKGNNVLNEQVEEIRETRESLLEKIELIQEIRELKEKI